MSDLSEEPEDATLLTHGEREGLIPSHITYRHELNEYEYENILKARSWVFARKRNPYAESFLRGLHRRMFDDVWTWAGQYRTTERNFGVAPWLIQPELHQLLDDMRHWVENKTYEPDEIAVRFHHRLVSIHPFANGNGRWSRLAADAAAVALGRKPFSWADSALRGGDETRKAYIAALRKADDHDIGPLIRFARS